MKKPIHPVTDHAVIRYLERVQGMDVEALRRAIGHRVGAAMLGNDGACGVVIDGFSYRIGDSGAVVTVIKASRPSRSQGASRLREIDDD
ncbi:hypothetical protein ACFSDD_09090 [Salipiger marinus]|jgi:hypothetical protein|uniref:hypothetical protein n=1 Tax=Salipiger marinus TaxID=555512 RepID=UPI002CAD2DA0|nr:hypothetical protein [Salipiger manganoxidans]MEB3421907.1 hypothetical protein [Salipiger manganoxidans]